MLVMGQRSSLLVESVRSGEKSFVIFWAGQTIQDLFPGTRSLIQGSSMLTKNGEKSAILKLKTLNYFVERPKNNRINKTQLYETIINVENVIL
jgi:hypothetical protein